MFAFELPDTSIVSGID